MIANETEYLATQAAAEQLQAALAAEDELLGSAEPDPRDIVRLAVEGQLQELRDQLAEYEQRQADARLHWTHRAQTAVRQIVLRLSGEITTREGPAVLLHPDVSAPCTLTSRSSLTTPMVARS
jgi:hypothetical protein